VRHGIADLLADRSEQVIRGRHLVQIAVEVSFQDRIEPCIGGRNLPLTELALDDEGVGGAVERNRGSAQSAVLMRLRRGLVLELHLDRRPPAIRRIVRRPTARLYSSCWRRRSAGMASTCRRYPHFSSMAKDT